jgi:hypothetical protein
MNFLNKLFGKKQSTTRSSSNEIHLGDQVKCGKCGAILTAKPMDPGKIVVGSAAAFEGLALKCSYCNLIVCSKCAMPMQTKPCPSCRNDFVPIIPKWTAR